MEFEIVKMGNKGNVECGDIIRKGSKLYLVFDSSYLESDYDIAILDLSSGSIDEGFESLADLKEWLVFDELIKANAVKLSVLSRQEKED